MSRWQDIVDKLLADLERETPGAGDFRANIDHKIWEAEQTVSMQFRRHRTKRRCGDALIARKKALAHNECAGRDP
jgi:hypothetical protein